MKIYFIYVTFGSLNEAKRLGSKLVKNKLAACTNIYEKAFRNLGSGFVGM